MSTVWFWLACIGLLLAIAAPLVVLGGQGWAGTLRVMLPVSVLVATGFGVARRLSRSGGGDAPRFKRGD
jgi:hypothetical protein